MARPPIHHAESVAFRYRSALELMTMVNGKTPKGETLGYLTAILYLSPHTSVSFKTLCPHSTAACREMCLSGAGLSGLPRAEGAKEKRTRRFMAGAEAFARDLGRDIAKLRGICEREGMKPVVRLNGTSDILWERIRPGTSRLNLMQVFPEIQFVDYTKFPLHLRRPPPNYHLIFSVGGPADMEVAVLYLRAGHSVAVVVPEDVKHGLAGLEMDLGPCAASFVDGDEHDLRFLDAPSSIVLLKPKGHVRTDLMRPHVLNELRAAAKVAA